ncbi:MAG: hypothetical protein M1828_000743 [Chrysothrix sp. TS-e1954]|nr:MAG: hypothetical protein M1828_000743 [Chrysothrix sp. TS-e1954]
MGVGNPSTAGYSIKYKDILQPTSTEKPVDSEKQSLWPFSVPDTQKEGWRLDADKVSGRLRWEYLQSRQERDAVPQTTAARYFMGLSTHAPILDSPKRPSESVHNAFRFWSRLQTEPAGCWAADLSCILFVTPMLIIAWYITGIKLSEPHAIEVAKFVLAAQDPYDGGWPTHQRGPTTVMGTALMYVALRLMGFPAEHERMVKGRTALLGMGGAVVMPCWAKFWFCMLRLYEWEGADPYPVEMWLLPRWVPINPWRWYTITRQVYLCMTYLSSLQFTVPPNPLLDEIRGEIFTDSYSSVNFAATKGVVLVCDRHQHKSWVLKCLNFILTHIWNPYFRTKDMARRGEEAAFEIIKLSDKATDTTGMITVDHALTMIAYYAREGPDSANVPQQHYSSYEYLWMDSDGTGMQAQSINGGATWETSLAHQTVISAGLANTPEFREPIRRSYEFLANAQHLDDWTDSPPCHRFPRIGGWPFSTRYHGYACADCTGESMKAILLTHSDTDLPRITTHQHMQLGVDNLLMSQNPDGGYASWEPKRTGDFLEFLNGTELFKGVMVEHTFAECTASALGALVLFKKIDNTYRAHDIQRTIDRGIDFIHRVQRPDGSWLADWGIACTYAAAFSVDVLAMVGETYENSRSVQRACDFLMDHHKADGGWGETQDSILTGVYTEAEDSHTVQTAWSCIALLRAQYPDQEPIKRGIRLIMSRQKADGEWLQERPVGSGILTCLIQYHNYIYTFTIKAMQLYIERYGNDELL